MARAHDRFRTPPELLVAALVVSATLPLGRLFRSGAVVPTILFTIAVGATLAWLLRRARIVAPLAAIVSGAAFFWFASLVFYRPKMLGPFPTPASVRAVASAVATGIHSATVEVAPVIGTAPMLVLISMIVWAAAWLADDAVHKLRHPLLAIGFVLPVFVFPATLLASPRRWLDSMLFIAASLAVLFSDESSRLARWGRSAGYGTPGWRPGLAVRTGGLVTIAAVAFAPLVPGYAREPGFGAGGDGFGPGDRVALNPLVNIRPRLSQTPATPLFTVRSPVAGYWRLTALDQFSGRVWTAPSRPADRDISAKVVPPTLPAAGSTDVRQQFQIQNLAGPWLPGSFEAARVDKRKRVRLEPVTRSLVLGDVLRSGQKFEVLSRIPGPDPKALESVTAAQMLSDPVGSQFLGLPRAGVPGPVAELARVITRQETSQFAKAVALQDYLRTFTYNESVADGHSFGSILEFLRVKEGYCEQFSATMAVFARLVGIPSRVAIGFAVGDRVGPNVFQITTRHAHAWVELYFPGFGWLPFEPTPRNDVAIVPGYTQPQTGAPQPSVAPSASANPSPTASASESIDPRLNRDEPGLGAAAASRGRDRRPILIPLALLLLAAGGLPGAVAVRRRLRRRRARDARALSIAHYVDFLEWCALARLPRGAGETPAEYAERLAGIAAPAEGPLREMAALTSGTLWAPSAVAAPDRVAGLGRDARKAIAATLPLRRRALGALGWGWWRT